MDDIDSVDIEPKCTLGASLIEEVKQKHLACKWAKIPLLREAVKSDK